MSIWDKLNALVDEWRDSNYESEYPLISEVLLFQRDEAGQLTYLREPQFHALEVYWYLRIKLKTPKFLELYGALFSKQSEKLEALGISNPGSEAFDFPSIDEYIRFVAQQPQNSALAESLSLDYASYIMALSMGTGKTVLIGTIIATEFVMSIEYNDKMFMKNALVFAPGTTIIESLKEISDIPFDSILPIRINKKFLANVKMVYARTNDKDIQIDRGGLYHIVVTNTEKISVKKRPVRKGQLKFDYDRQRKQDELTANARLGTIASLPNLGVFSDEAHHTYGSKLGDEMKRVRRTIDHLHTETNILCVVNTTGTPYTGNQTLMDVVFWYSLDRGIRDGILKSLEDGIITYDFEYTPPAEVFDQVVVDFFNKYRETRLIGGQKAKIAFYFKSQNHLDESRPLIEKALTQIGESTSEVLMNTQQSTAAEIDEFKRLNNPDSTKRVILLVGKGTEGWNCPSLFATALIRELTSSNNFILQASTRCLRQVEGNNQPATIYIEAHNQSILNSELQKTYGTSLYALSKEATDVEQTSAIFYKTDLPELEITKVVKRIVGVDRSATEIKLTRPKDTKEHKLHMSVFTPVTEKTGIILSNTGEERDLVFESDSYDLFTAAKLIAQQYHLSISDIYTKLCAIYADEIPNSHMVQLCLQVEEQTSNYKEEEQTLTQALALVKFQDDEGKPIFKKKDGHYYHTIRYKRGRADLIVSREEYAKRNTRGLSFHYSPYNFDSKPEKVFLEEMLGRLKVNHDDVTDIYFTGGLTSPTQTDFYFQYLAFDGRYHNYFPDFIVVKKNGDFLIVEVKDKDKQNDAEVIAKRKAVERLEKLPKNHFKYHILYTDLPIPEPKIAEVMEKL